jgi:hypothetical protein
LGLNGYFVVISWSRFARHSIHRASPATADCVVSPPVACACESRNWLPVLRCALFGDVGVDLGLVSDDTAPEAECEREFAPVPHVPHRRHSLAQLAGNLIQIEQSICHEHNLH